MVLPDEPLEYFFFVADGLPMELRSELRQAIAQLIARGKAGSTIHLIRTPDHAAIASFELGEGTVAQRMRQRALQKVLPEINAFLSDTSPVPEDFRCQLGLPRLLDSYWSLKQTPLLSRIILIGDPVYHDPENPIWSFRGGKYPSDATINASTSTLPMKRMGRQPLASDIPVVWIANDAFGVDQLHHDALTRFYTLLFAKSLGGQLSFFGRTVASAMQPSLDVGLATPDEFFPDGFPQMLRVPTVVEVPKPTDSPATPDNINPQAALESARRDPTQTAIAINWTSDDPLTDVDIRLSVKGQPGELNFTNMNTDFGRLLRDVRRPGSLSDANRDNWEVAVIKHDNMADLIFWLNLYEGQAPSAIKIILVHRGKESSQTAAFPPIQGDRALASLFRKMSPAWHGPVNLLANR
ncbi:MAG: hypothetical protein IT423_03665 [Pirellulaceae bacterium]|nr:hypothetical protein [Pirellulaceae bacterium]